MPLEHGPEGTRQGAEIPGMVLEITHGVQTCLCQQVRRDHANSVKRATWERTQECRPIPIGDEGQSIRLRKVARQFGEELVGGDSDAGGQGAGFTNGALELTGQRQGGKQGCFGIRVTVAARKSRDIEIGLIDRDLFHQCPGLADQLKDLPGFRPVQVHPGPDKDAVGAEPAGGPAGHGRADPETSRLVARRSDDPALIRRRTHDDGTSLQARILALFDGRVKSVHIEVENDPRHPASMRGEESWAKVELNWT